MGRRRRGARSKTASRHHRSAHRRPQHHDVDEGGRQTGLVRRGLRGAARASRRLHGAAHGGFRKERHPRHLVCARRRRLPACAPGAQPAARQGRARHARHRRRRLRHGARIQGLAFRRARRRHRALGIPRGDVRRRAGARFRGGERPLRSARPVQSRQDRAGAEIRRPRQFPLRPGLSRRGHRQRARLVGLFGRRRRFPGRGRDVQQQRRLPRALGRRHVPELPRHPRRARRHPRPRQHVAACHHRPARPGRAHVRCHGGDAEALRLVQGVPARMPDRRRHGAHEDRGVAHAERKIRHVAARPPGRLSAALRAHGGEAVLAAQFARR